MRLVVMVAMLLVVVGSAGVRLANADAAGHESSAVVVEVSRGVDVDGDPEDDRVEVQLAVLGIVVITVFVLGTGAWLLRRKLGLTEYTPPADSAHH